MSNDERHAVARTVRNPLRLRFAMLAGALVCLGAAVLLQGDQRPAQAQGNGVPFERLLQRIVALEQTTKQQAAEITALRSALAQEAGTRAEADAAVGTHVAELQYRTQFVKVVDGEMYIEGTNLHLVNGMGATEAVNGKGNLIVGYNEAAGSVSDRSGSHNVVVGSDHRYASYGGLVAGCSNRLYAPYASVTGGYHHWASGWASSISGGYDNEAWGACASVSGGWYNTAYGNFSSISGGGGGIWAPDYSWAAGAGSTNTYTGNFRSY